LRWAPLAAADLPAFVAARIIEQPGTVRVAVDGAPPTEPSSLAAALVPLLERAGRPVAHVLASTFWRDASLRLEYGREDVESYLTGWLDTGALSREVLLPVVTTGTYLPSLRDPASNRSTREAPRELGAGGVLIVSGSLLLGHGLPFDLSVHLHLSSSALARRSAAEDAWTLPAYAEYDATVAPCESAALVFKVDDPRHPAVRVE
jgi:hypothetical protein